MRTFWRWLGEIRLTVRWPKQVEAEDWASEGGMRR